MLIDRFRAKKGVKKMVGARVRVETPALLDEALKREAKGVCAGTQSALQHPNKRVTALALDVGATQQ